MDIPVLFEDSDVIIVDKPPGIVVNRAQSVKGETVQDWAEDYLQIQNPNPKIQMNVQNQNSQNSFEFRDLNLEFLQRAGIVHRIDKETSGILVIAKNPVAFAKLQAQFKERNIQKTYLALVHGDVVPAEGDINAPVGRLPWNRERFGILPDGKEAITHYKKIQTVVHGKSSETVSLVELSPHTGRTHQIRVHMQYIRHPLIGDYVYAGRKTSRLDRTWVPRTMLHAWKMTLTHPTTGTPLAIEAPIPDDMNKIINSKY